MVGYLIVQPLAIESYDYIHQFLHGWGSHMALACHTLVINVSDINFIHIKDIPCNIKFTIKYKQCHIINDIT